MLSTMLSNILYLQTYNDFFIHNTCVFKRNGTESFIWNSIAFNKAKINFETDSEETENISSKISVESSSSTVTTTWASGEQQQHMESTALLELTTITITTTTTTTATITPTTTTTVPVAELLNVETSMITKEESKASTVAAALFPQYLRRL